MTAKRVDAAAVADGLTINGHVFDGQLPLERYEDVLGPPSHTIDAGRRNPSGIGTTKCTFLIPRGYTSLNTTLRG